MPSIQDLVNKISGASPATEITIKQAYDGVVAVRVVLANKQEFEVDGYDTIVQALQAMQNKMYG